MKQIPYDEAPFEATLRPGEKVKLYGDVEIQNEATEAAEVVIRFDLREGFILTVDALVTPIHFEVQVGMHMKYAIKEVSETWQIVARNLEPVSENLSH